MTPQFPADQIKAILENLTREFPLDWSLAHRDGDPRRWNFIIRAIARLESASNGTVLGNWRRAVPGDLSMDGVSFLGQDWRWYFADVIGGAGGPNPTITFNVTGDLRNSRGEYVGRTGAASILDLQAHGIDIVGGTGVEVPVESEPVYKAEEVIKRVREHIAPELLTEDRILELAQHAISLGWDQNLNRIPQNILDALLIYSDRWKKTTPADVTIPRAEFQTIVDVLADITMELRSFLQ